MYKNITVVGTGYVGLSLATLLSQTRNVIALDIDQEKVDLINKRISPIEDSEITRFFNEKELKLKATTDPMIAYEHPDVVIIATPTDYDEINDSFNTKSIENVMKDMVSVGLSIPVILKSTIPIGYVDRIKVETGYLGEILFSPEFLREGRALLDNLYPSRIVLGSESDASTRFGELLREHALNSDEVEIFQMSNSDAEAVKLFSNTYLAMRVAFFNELDTFTEVSGLNSNKIINAVSADPRIGNHYNNPSFGYGGYCLPKDTKQLKANYSGIPETLITSIVESNQVRKQHIAQMVLNRKPNVVGVYKLAMKSGSDNFRQSSIIDVINILKEAGIRVIVYEPILTDVETEFELENNIDDFKNISDVIITNRTEKDLDDVLDKLYTRDAFNRD